jgi:hypothetical protein
MDGQAATLLRHRRPVVSTRHIDKMMQVSSDPDDSMPVRHAWEVAKGLGLTAQNESIITEHVTGWLKQDNEASYRKAVFSGVRELVTDLVKRRTITKRCMQLWRSRPGADDETVVQKGYRRLVLKAEQLGLFGSRPSGDWQAIPGGKHGGYRKPKAGGGFDYWYPSVGVQSKPNADDEPSSENEKKIALHTAEYGRLDAVRESLSVELPTWQTLRHAFKDARDLHKRAARLYERGEVDRAGTLAKNATDATHLAEKALGAAQAKQERKEKIGARGPTATQKDALALATDLGIPAEVSGARSIALGEPASFDRSLGKWNGLRGDAARRVVQATTALKWLQERKENKKKESEGKPVTDNFRARVNEYRAHGWVLSRGTYAHREAIKASGGIWDQVRREWILPSRAAYDAMRQLIYSTPVQPLPPAQPRPTSTRTASEKQVNYAVALLHKLVEDDFGTATTFGYHAMRRSDLEKMSAADVSSIIDHLRDELY